MPDYGQQYGDDLQRAIRSIIREMIERATRDEGFRELCLKQPAEAFRQTTGYALPRGANLRFAEPGEVAAFVLPRPGEALDDEALEQTLRTVCTRRPRLGPDGVAYPVIAYGIYALWARIIQRRLSPGR